MRQPAGLLQLLHDREDRRVSRRRLAMSRSRTWPTVASPSSQIFSITAFCKAPRSSIDLRAIRPASLSAQS